VTSPRILLDNEAGKLPSPSGVALAIMDLWNKDDTTVDQLSRLIQADPALTGRLLKLANSALHGTRTVVAIPEAIVRVGLRTVGQIAVSFSLIENSQDGHCSAFDYQRFWSRSLLMAVLCRRLAAETSVTAPEELFACGLLARVGELALATIYPSEFGYLLQLDDGRSLAEKTSTRFGCNHCELSYELMTDYRVPDALAEPARHHEAPLAAGFAAGSRSLKIALLIHLAYLLSDSAIGDADSTRIPLPLPVSLLRTLNFSDGRLQGLFDDCIAEWRDWSSVLNLPAIPEGDFPRLAHDQQTAPRSLESDEVQRCRRAIVLGDAVEISPLIAALEQAGFDARTCADPDSVLSVAVSFQPQLIVLGPRGNPDSTSRLCNLMRSTEWGAAVYIMVIGDATETAQTAHFLASGADSVTSANLRQNDLVAHLSPVHRHLDLQEGWHRDRARLRRLASDLSISQNRFERLSLTDQLTGLPNRRAGLQALDRAWGMSERQGLSLCLTMLDIDHFKRINDEYGHAAGDEALRRVANILQGIVRSEDIVCRLGGEEFLIVCLGYGIRDMLVAAERLRKRIGNEEISVQGGYVKVTSSLGALERTASDASANALLRDVDRAMYVAKNNGRNCLAFRKDGEIRMLRKD
jgi:diguanylate cyclase (GGDEF)-like protein